MKTGKHWKDVINVILEETDVVIHVLDGRNPIGTHNQMVEDFITKNKPNMKIILLLNKVDIIPKPVMIEWVKYFQEKGYEIHTASAKYQRGVHNFLKSLRSDTKFGLTNILIVGYPNTGKSTLIESLTRNTKKVGVSKKAGFTRAIKRIKITENLFLIDTPGIIPIDETNETDIAIKSCMVADMLEDPLAVIEAIFSLVDIEQFRRVYEIDISPYDGVEELITKIGIKRNKFLKGGIINKREIQNLIIRDWQSNKIRYFVQPPTMQEPENASEEKISTLKSQNGAIPRSLTRRKKT